MENNVPPTIEGQTPTASHVPPSYVAMPEMAKKPKSSWLMVIGIICIVFGILGVMGSIWQAAAPFTMQYMANIIPGQSSEQIQATVDSMTRWRYPLLGVGVGDLILSGVLILCGVQLINSKPGCIGLFQKWAIAKILFSLVSVSVTTMAQMEQMKVSMQLQMQTMGPGGPPPQFMETMLMITLVFTVIFGLVFACALPVFILIWFSRKKVKAEIATW